MQVAAAAIGDEYRALLMPPLYDAEAARARTGSGAGLGEALASFASTALSSTGRHLGAWIMPFVPTSVDDATDGAGGPTPNGPGVASSAAGAGGGATSPPTTGGLASMSRQQLRDDYAAFCESLRKCDRSSALSVVSLQRSLSVELADEEQRRLAGFGGNPVPPGTSIMRLASLLGLDKPRDVRNGHPWVCM